MIDLQPIEQRLRLASKGKWEDHNDDGWTYVTVDNEYMAVVHNLRDDSKSLQALFDTQFIAHSYEDVVALVAEVVQLRAALEALAAWKKP